jgi:hypothetical protein
MRSDPILAWLAIGFALAGAISAYYLVKFLRERRYPLRFSTIAPGTILNGREAGYIYRDRNPAGYWFEMGFQTFAVMVSVAMIILLISVS